MASAPVFVLLAACVGQALGVLVFDDSTWPVKPVKPVKPVRPSMPTPPPAAAPEERCTESEVGAKDLDLLMYGVTGYTGKLAALYLNSRAGKEPTWAIAGRDLPKLKWVFSLAKNDGSNPPGRALHLDLGNKTRAAEVVKRARVVLNFAGPYEPNHGETLIRAALAGCAHYVDISTELNWKASMLNKYAKLAETRGVALVQSAGFESLASDLLAMSAIQDAVDAQGAAPAGVMVVWTKVNAAVSGGMVATAEHEARYHALSSDPYILAPETPSEKRMDWTIDGMDDYSFKPGVGMMVKDYQARKNCPLIRRSIMALFPDTPAGVRQAMVGSNLTFQREHFLKHTVDPHAEPMPSDKPLPGEGPPHWVRAKGSFAGYAVAKGTWGDKSRQSPGTRVTFEGKQDPLVMGSARMATEVALALAWEGPQGGKGGYLTPTTVVGTRRLEHTMQAVQAVGNGERLYSFTHEKLG